MHTSTQNDSKEKTYNERSEITPLTTKLGHPHRHYCHQQILILTLLPPQGTMRDGDLPFSDDGVPQPPLTFRGQIYQVLSYSVITKILFLGISATSLQ